MNRIPPFTEDSRLIEWPASRIAEPCATEGASKPVRYSAGIAPRAHAAEYVVALIFLAVLWWVAITWGE